MEDIPPSLLNNENNMCRLCDRAWLRLNYNTRWGAKHWESEFGNRAHNKSGYNQYFPKYPLERVNRAVIYNAETCSKRLNW